MKKKKAVIIAGLSIAAVVLCTAVFFLMPKDNTDGVGDMGNISYNGQEMLLLKSGINELPAEYSLSSDMVDISDNALLISGEYEVYSSESTDEIIYIFVDDENISQANRGYWQFVTPKIYNENQMSF